MNPDMILLFTLSGVGVAEVVLAYRVWRLERRMMQVMQHFIKAKDFLGGIEKHVREYRGIVDHVAKNGIDVTAKHPTLGEFKLTIHKGNGDK